MGLALTMGRGCQRKGCAIAPKTGNSDIPRITAAAAALLKVLLSFLSCAGLLMFWGGEVDVFLCLNLRMWGCRYSELLVSACYDWS